MEPEYDQTNLATYPDNGDVVIYYDGDVVIYRDDGAEHGPEQAPHTPCETNSSEVLKLEIIFPSVLDNVF